MGKQYKSIIILSGGMDSVTLLHHLVKEYAYSSNEILALTFDYGQRHKDKELMAARWQTEHLEVDHEVINLRALRPLMDASSLTNYGHPIPEGHYAEESMRSTVVPNRNMIMLSIAIGAAVNFKAEMVATAVHAGDHFVYPDCRPPFFAAMGVATMRGNDGFINPDFGIYTPFLDFTKGEIARRGELLGVSWRHTYSCYQGGEVHCGKCGTCTERIEAFAEAGIVDPTFYNTSL